MSTGTAVDQWSAEVVEDHLREVSRTVRRAMLAAIPDGEPHRWLYRITRAYPSRAGKAIRPALCLAANAAFGGVDADVLRRHTRGMAPAVADRVLDEFDTMTLRTLEGQATELGWQRDTVTALTPEDYLDLIMHKTCWYTTIHPLRVGALVGSRGAVDQRTLVRFGFFLGAAFQIQDDLLNLEGDEADYGKEISGDLFEGKRTLVLIHLMQHATGADRVVVDEYLRLDRSGRTPALVVQIRELMHRYGSVEFTRAYAAGIAGAAHAAFDEAFAGVPESDATRFLRSLIPYMLDRRS